MAFTDYLTVEGERLLAKSIAGGHSIDVTKVILGTGYLAEGTSARNISAVITPHKTLDVQSVAISGESSVVIAAYFDNADLQEGFYLREKGIYISVDGEEALAIYGNAGSSAEYIDTADVCVIEKTLRTVLQLTSEEIANVTLTAQGMGLSDVYKEKVDGADATGDIAASQNAVYYVYRDLSEQISNVELKVDNIVTEQGNKFEEVDSKVETAQSTADTALTKANSAQSAADTAKSAAETAQVTADRATSIAKGKNQARVFSTTEKMYEWLADESNKGVANVGDNLYIVDVGVPDWWIAEVLEEPNDSGYYYELGQLETQKVDLTTIESAISDLEESIEDINSYLGRSKNLLNHSATTTEKNGLTFTVNEDKSITVNGTATADTTLTLASYSTHDLEFDENAIFSGCPSGGSKDTYCMYIELVDSSDNAVSAYDTGNGFPTGGLRAYLSELSIKVISGVTMDNVTFYPMIRLASVEDDTYEPYVEDIQTKVADLEDVTTLKTIYSSSGYSIYKYGRVVSINLSGVTLQVSNTQGMFTIPYAGITPLFGYAFFTGWIVINATTGNLYRPVRGKIMTSSYTMAIIELINDDGSTEAMPTSYACRLHASVTYIAAE